MGRCRSFVPKRAAVLFGVWRGKRLRATEQRLQPGANCEMATVELHENDNVSDAVARRLTRAAVELNRTLGNPTDI